MKYSNANWPGGMRGAFRCEYKARCVSPCCLLLKVCKNCKLAVSSNSVALRENSYRDFQIALHQFNKTSASSNAWVQQSNARLKFVAQMPYGTSPIPACVHRYHIASLACRLTHLLTYLPTCLCLYAAPANAPAITCLAILHCMIGFTFLPYQPAYLHARLQFACLFKACY